MYGAKLLLAVSTIVIASPLLHADPRQLAEERRAMAELARGLPPEFAADALIRMAETGKLEGKAYRADALEHAFQRAQSAFAATAVAPVPIGFTDSVAAMQGRAGVSRVDRLSLQARAIRQMAAIDPGKALSLLQSVSIPNLRERRCDTPVIPDVRLFYQAVAFLAEASGLPELATGEAREELVIDQLRKISASSQVFALAAALATIKLPPDSFKRVTGVFAAAMEGVEDGDRSFSIELFHEAGRHSIASLLSRCEAGECDYRSLLSSTARYYRRHLTATRCEDTFLDENHRTARAEAVKELNGRLAAAGLLELAITEPSPQETKIDRAHKAVDLFETDPQYRTMMLEVMSLRRTKGDSRGSPEDDPAGVLLGRLADWRRPSSIRPEEFFLIKSEIFGGLVQTTAGTSNADKTLSAYVSYLNLNDNQRQEFPGAWLWRVLQLLQGALRMREEPTARSAWQALVTTELERSPNLVLSFYARLHRIGAIE
jgi:hypothetical protein